jgi:hypothetical protein
MQTHFIKQAESITAEYRSLNLSDVIDYEDETIHQNFAGRNRTIRDD